MSLSKVRSAVLLFAFGLVLLDVLAGCELAPEEVVVPSEPARDATSFAPERPTRRVKLHDPARVYLVGYAFVLPPGHAYSVNSAFALCVDAPSSDVAWMMQNGTPYAGSPVTANVHRFQREVAPTFCAPTPSQPLLDGALSFPTLRVIEGPCSSLRYPHHWFFQVSQLWNVSRVAVPSSCY